MTGSGRGWVTTRETLLYELAVEAVLRVPFAVLVAEARRSGACDPLDLLQLGRRLYIDLARLARGEISTIGIPRRLPRQGEHALTAVGRIPAT